MTKHSKILVPQNFPRFLLIFGYLFSTQVVADVFFPLTPNDLIADIIIANGNGVDDVIHLGDHTFTLNCAYPNTDGNGNTGLPSIAPDSGFKLKIKDGTIVRSGTCSTGSNEFRFFDIQAGAHLILEDVTLENGHLATGAGVVVDGGAIANFGKLELEDSTLVDNTAVEGGALYNDTAGVVSINGDTFSGNAALSGGAIYNAGSMECITTTRFLNNASETVGGALYNAPGATIEKVTRSLFDQNVAILAGGAIYNDGTVAPGGIIGSIAYTTFSSAFTPFVAAFGFNSEYGGAIYNGALIGKVTACTFSDLIADFDGGAIFVAGPNSGAGGAGNGDFGIIRNSTFSSNTVLNDVVPFNRSHSAPAALGSGGAIFVDVGGLISAFVNSTVALNSAPTGSGGGIYSAGTLTNFISNIVAYNSAATCPDIDEAVKFGGQVTYDLVSNSGISGCLLSFTNGVNHNIVGVDPLLSSLANNGGPTLTHALRPLSPAIDAGSNPDHLAFDQRGPGHPRTVGPATDIGAFEVCEDFDLDGDCDHDETCEDRDHDGRCDNDDRCPDFDRDGRCDRDDHHRCRHPHHPDYSDRDHDGVGDDCDNCPRHHNPDQRDRDRDGHGDACDRRNDRDRDDDDRRDRDDRDRDDDDRRDRDDRDGDDDDRRDRDDRDDGQSRDDGGDSSAPSMSLYF